MKTDLRKTVTLSERTWHATDAHGRPTTFTVKITQTDGCAATPDGLFAAVYTAFVGDEQRSSGFARHLPETGRPSGWFGIEIGDETETSAARHIAGALTACAASERSQLAEACTAHANGDELAAGQIDYLAFQLTHTLNELRKARRHLADVEDAAEMDCPAPDAVAPAPDGHRILRAWLGTTTDD